MFCVFHVMMTMTLNQGHEYITEVMGTCTILDFALNLLFSPIISPIIHVAHNFKVIVNVPNKILVDDTVISIIVMPACAKKKNSKKKTEFLCNLLVTVCKRSSLYVTQSTLTLTMANSEDLYV